MKAEKKTSDGGGTDTTVLMFGTLLDTTWRMFVPVILFALMGYGIDEGFGIKPAATLIGLAIGVFASFALVAVQLKKILKQTNQEQEKK